MKITILGARGFVGSHLLRHLENQGHEVFAPTREELYSKSPLHHVIYCIGTTSDFRKRPFDTVEAHVCVLKNILQHSDFDSLLYLSSTRVYEDNQLGQEHSNLTCNPHDVTHLFNLSKLMGESLCLNSGRANVKIARLSNVYGNDFNSGNFLFAIIREALSSNHIKLQTALDSAKDYVSISDVVKLLEKISLEGQKNIYNVASGYNVSHKEIVEQISQVTSCTYDVLKAAPSVVFPPIDVSRIKSEFNFDAEKLTDNLFNIINLCQNLGV